MTERGRPVWRRHPWLTLTFVLAVVLALGFAGRAAKLALDWNRGPAPVEDWMTPRYLVHSYDIDPEVLAAVLDKQPGESPRDTLAEIARAHGVPVADLLAAVQALVAAPGTAP
jgi:hypothetical protein